MVTTAPKKRFQNILLEETKGYDVMLSYQWNSKKKVTEIRNYLVANDISVWMDEEQMHGKLNDRMAEGVVNSKVVMLCLSSDYEKSHNCKKEFI